VQHRVGDKIVLAADVANNSIIEAYTDIQFNRAQKDGEEWVISETIASERHVVRQDEKIVVIQEFDIPNADRAEEQIIVSAETDLPDWNLFNNELYIPVYKEPARVTLDVPIEEYPFDSDDEYIPIQAEGVTLTGVGDNVFYVDEDGIRFTAAVFPEDASGKGIDWSSSNPTVVSVDPGFELDTEKNEIVDTTKGGTLTLNAPCTAIITAATKDGQHKASILVTVKKNTMNCPFAALSAAMPLLTVTGSAATGLPTRPKKLLLSKRRLIPDINLSDGLEPILMMRTHRRQY
jgi:uncharacterized protein YjdB